MKILFLGHYDAEIFHELDWNFEIVQFKEAADFGVIDAEILVTRGHVTINFDLLDRLPKIKLLIKAGSGVDNIDLLEAKNRNIKVITTPESTYSVAEMAFGLMLAVQRRILMMDKELRKGNWSVKYQLPGRQLKGNTLGVIGFGKIGREVASIGVGFRMKVYIYDRSSNKESKQKIAQHIGVEFKPLEYLLENCDIISIHIPLTEETKGLIGKNELKRIKSGCVLINTARADIIDYDGLIEALENGKLGGYGVDVFHNEPLSKADKLLKFSNTVCTPHIGAQTVETFYAIGQKIVSVIKEYKSIKSE